ncbi:MAG: dockerin type I repeat-containing protein [Prevotellaceae bacterium]|nr:dockerin type I repeat-containing protein [Prevotellaceae bacterium]
MRIFTSLFAIVFCGMVCAQGNYVVLAPETEKECTSDGILSFTNCDLTLDTGSGDQTAGSTDITSRHWNNNVTFLGWKVSKNDKVTINIPDGQKLYKLELYGFSNGDNWDYLLNYGEDEWGDPAWVDELGEGVKDNAKIQEATYPIDPCGYVTDGAKTEWTKENAGYTFASLDFTDAPYEGKFTFVISGNNTCAIGLRCWLEAPGPGGDEVKGDANSDGNVDVSDITTVATYILTGSADNFNFKNADVDGDNSITVSDITGIASIILGN